MRIHILGICGTFMGGLALIAKQQGHEVSGSDEAVYPPMSTMLEENGIKVLQGYDAKHLEPAPDCVVIGNALSRGNKAVEQVLARGLPYISGPQWLAENVLSHCWVLAVAGTHGKTTTSAMLAWILEYAGLNPGFLIGGVPISFGVSARFTESPFFVIEADEYDSAFFDKRSKFLHYRARTLILNNLEFDHADIFPDLEAIKKQFQYLLRIVPNNGLVIYPPQDNNLSDVIKRGCWTQVTTFGQGMWQAKNCSEDGSKFDVFYENKKQGTVNWSLIGQHNIHNALAAIAAAQHAGVLVEQAIEALKNFRNVKRRMEIKGRLQDVTVYDDFAHHPTAIATTLSGLRKKVGNARIIAIVEFGSNTMKAGFHQDELHAAFIDADFIALLRPEKAEWNIDELSAELPKPARVYPTVDSIVDDVILNACVGDHVLVMSNKSFGGIHEKLLAALRKTEIAPNRSGVFS